MIRQMLIIAGGVLLADAIKTVIDVVQPKLATVVSRAKHRRRTYRIYRQSEAFRRQLESKPAESIFDELRGGG